MLSSTAALALDVRGVVKRYGSHDALRGVDLAAACGRVHGLLGPNGAGKTTLLRCLLGVVRVDEGSIRLLGAELPASGGPPPPRVAGLVDTPAFYPYLSGRRNLELLQRLDGTDLPGADRRAAVDEVLDRVGLSTRAADRAAGYSAGMRQRLGLAAALLRQPQLLLLDEPTAALDPAAARELRDIARSLASDGAAVLLSSHDMAEVEDMCDSITVINRGRVVFAGTADEMRALAPHDPHVLHTSDDRRALELARTHAPLRDVRVTARLEGGLEITGATAAIDHYTMALGSAGIAIRHFERRARTIESVFFELTGDWRAPRPSEHARAS